MPRFRRQISDLGRNGPKRTSASRPKRCLANGAARGPFHRTTALVAIRNGGARAARGAHLCPRAFEASPTPLLDRWVNVSTPASSHANGFSLETYVVSRTTRGHRHAGRIVNRTGLWRNLQHPSSPGDLTRAPAPVRMFSRGRRSIVRRDNRADHPRTRRGTARAASDRKCFRTRRVASMRQIMTSRRPEDFSTSRRRGGLLRTSCQRLQDSSVRAGSARRRADRRPPQA